MSDPWAFQRWAFATTTGNPVRKAVLSFLATMADSNTGRCEARQGTLAQGVEASERAVRGHLKALEVAGIIARRQQRRRDGSRRGDEFLLLAPWVSEWPDGETVQAADGAGSDRNGSTDPPGTDLPDHAARAAGQEQPERTTTENGRPARAPADTSRIPDDFPEELRPHARIVLPILRRVAADHNAREVKPLALGRMMMGRPHKPFVKSAHDFAAWAADPPRPIRDAVASYRTWLDNERDLQTTEKLPGAVGASEPEDVYTRND